MSSGLTCRSDNYSSRRSSLRNNICINKKDVVSTLTPRHKNTAVQTKSEDRGGLLLGTRQ